MIPELIPYDKLTEKQCRYICENLIGVPLSIDVTLEVLPAITEEVGEHETEIVRYAEGENFAYYLDRFREEWANLLLKSWWGPDNVGMRDKRLLAAITISHPDTIDGDGKPMKESRYYDLQSGIIHEDADDPFLVHFDRIFDHFIAPIALLSQDTHRLPGMCLTNGETPDPAARWKRDRQKAAEVWSALGGTVKVHRPLPGSAGEMELQEWTWEDKRVNGEYWSRIISEFFAWCRGRFGAATVAEWRLVARKIDEALWEASQDAEEDDEEEDEDFDPIDDDFTPEEVEAMKKAMEEEDEEEEEEDEDIYPLTETEKKIIALIRSEYYQNEYGDDCYFFCSENDAEKGKDDADKVPPRSQIR